MKYFSWSFLEKIIVLDFFNFENKTNLYRKDLYHQLVLYLNCLYKTILFLIFICIKKIQQFLFLDLNLNFQGENFKRIGTWVKIIF